MRRRGAKRLRGTPKRAPNRAPATPSCSVVTELIDAHRLGPQRRAPGRKAIVPLFRREAGVGDHVSGLLSALTIAIATGRRLEVLPDRIGAPSYVATGFHLPFDAQYTGELGWLDAALATEGRLRRNFTQEDRSGVRVKELPRFAPDGEAWGLTEATNDGPLAARLIVPSPSGAYRPMHGRALTRPHELFIGGNTGSNVFRAWFGRELALRNVTYSTQHMACALRHVLRPSPAAVAAMDRLRPWPAVTSERLVGVHIRAEAHLVSRAALNENARYSGGDVDAVFSGCANAAARTAVDAYYTANANTSVNVSFPAGRHQTRNFSEYWLVSNASSRWLESSTSPDLAPKPLPPPEAKPGVRAEGGKACGCGERTRCAPGRLVRRGGVWSYRAHGSGCSTEPSWFLVSDSLRLKHAAKVAWQSVVHITDIEPTQVGACGASRQRRDRKSYVSPHVAVPAPTAASRATAHVESVLETVAELLLLAESRVLVFGRSRFPVVALLLSRSARQAYRVRLDPVCYCGGAQAEAAAGRAAREGRKGPAGCERVWRASHTAAMAAPDAGVGPAPTLTPAASPRSKREADVWRCVGPERAYSVRQLLDASGTLLPDVVFGEF